MDNGKMNEPRPSNSDVRDLVKKAKKNDSHAFALLYEMVYEDLYKMALYTLCSKEDAEDAVSETVLEAYVGIKKLRDETAFRGWIFKILSNKCKKQIAEYMKNRANVESEPVEEFNDIQSEGASTEDVVVNQQLLEKAFEAISAEDRLIVTMVVYGGYDSKEIANELKINRNTVRSRYKRALEKMQKFITG